MVYCPSCGSAFEDDARFCSYCGAKSGGETEEPARPREEEPAAAPDEPQAAPAEPVRPPEAGRREQPQAQPHRRPPDPQDWGRDRPISAWGYFGWFVLFCIPAIGWLFLLMAICGVFGNRHIAAMARGCFFFAVLLAIALITLVGLLIIPWGWVVHSWPWAEWGEWWRQILWYR